MYIYDFIGGVDIVANKPMQFFYLVFFSFQIFVIYARKHV